MRVTVVSNAFLLLLLSVMILFQPGCHKKDNKPIVPVPPAISADFTSDPTSGDPPLTVQFTDTSTGTITSWDWDFDNDGTVDSTVQNSTHTYSALGRYTVSLTVTGPDGSDIETKTDYITVGSPPVADFTAAPAVGLAPLAVSFTDASTGNVTSWQWDFDNDGTIDSTAQNASYTYTNGGSYSTRLAVTGPVGSDEETKTSCITVYIEPIADFAASPTTGTAPLTVQFNDISTGTVVNWAWDFENDGTYDSGTQNPVHVYTVSGTYSVKHAAIGPLSVDTKVEIDYIQVTWSPPAADFTAGPTTGAAPLTVIFTDTSTGNITAWAWDFENDGTIDSTAQNPTHIYTSPGPYTVRLTINGPDGPDEEIKTGCITVNWPPPAADFTADQTTGTPPLTVQFTDISTGNITAWSWDFGDSGTSSQPSPTHVYTAQGTYRVELAVAGPGGSDTESKYNYITVSSTSPPATWVRTWGGSEWDFLATIAADSSSSIYCAGATYSFGAGGWDGLLLKYNSSGELQWAKSWGGIGTEELLEAVVGSGGDIYCAGRTESFGAGGWDALLLRYDSTGTLQWVKTWGTGSGDAANAIAIDSNNNVYCAGDAVIAGARGTDTLLLKYNSLDELQWAKTWGGTGIETLYGIAVDSAGNIWCSGCTNSFGAGYRDALLLKYNSSGELQWAKTWGGSDQDMTGRVALDSGGNVYCAGDTQSFTAGGCAALLLKYNSSGVLQWAKTWGGGGWDKAGAVVVGTAGDIYCAGTTDSFDAGSDDALLLKYDTSGTLQWARIWGGSDIDETCAVALDSDNNIYLAGNTVSYSGLWQEITTATEGTPVGIQALQTGIESSPTGTQGSSTGTEGTPAGSQAGAGDFDAFLLRNW